MMHEYMIATLSPSYRRIIMFPPSRQSASRRITPPFAPTSTTLISLIPHLEHATFVTLVVLKEFRQRRFEARRTQTDGGGGDARSADGGNGSIRSDREGEGGDTSTAASMTVAAVAVSVNALGGGFLPPSSALPSPVRCAHTLHALPATTDVGSGGGGSGTAMVMLGGRAAEVSASISKGRASGDEVTAASPVNGYSNGSISASFATPWVLSTGVTTQGFDHGAASGGAGGAEICGGSAPRFPAASVSAVPPSTPFQQAVAPTSPSPAQTSTPLHGHAAALITINDDDPSVGVGGGNGGSGRVVVVSYGGMRPDGTSTDEVRIHQVVHGSSDRELAMHPTMSIRRRYRRDHVDSAMRSRFPVAPTSP